MIIDMKLIMMVTIIDITTSKLSTIINACSSDSLLKCLGTHLLSQAPYVPPLLEHEFCVGPNDPGIRNTSSSLVLGFARSIRLRIVGSGYQRPEMHCWTWYNNARRVVKETDYILVEDPSELQGFYGISSSLQLSCIIYLKILYISASDDYPRGL